MEQKTMFNIKFDNLSFSELGDFIAKHIDKREPTYIVTCNVDHVVKLQHDAEFRHVYDQAGAVVADGQPLIWASKWLGKPLKQKLSGSDLFRQLGHRFAAERYSVFFLGAAPGIAEKAARQVEQLYPGIQIAGTHSPSYSFDKQEAESQSIVQMIRQARPDIVLVGAGAPKQEKWIHAHYKQYEAPVSIGVGATFDFISGNVRRAPLMLQKMGLEWLFRLMQEPGRLWRRYLVEDRKFVKLLLQEKRKFAGQHVKEEEHFGKGA